MTDNCSNCSQYLPEYQGKYADFINYCKVRKCSVPITDFCFRWDKANEAQMAARKRVWDMWKEVEMFSKKVMQNE